MKNTRTPSVNNLRTRISTLAVLLLPLAGMAQPTTNWLLSLDGNGDYVTVASAAELQNPTELSIEAWIRPQQSGHNNNFFINKSDGATGGSSRSYELRWAANGGETGPGSRVEFHVFLNNGYWTVAGAPAAQDAWIHVAACFSSSQGVLRLFTNGILAATSTADIGSFPLSGATVRQTTLPVRLGRVDYSPYDYARGYMDEVRIWNKSRTPEEIYRDRFCRLVGNEPNLVAYWTFDDGTATDRTGRGHNGTFAGNAQAVPVQGNDVVHDGVCGATLTRVATANAAVMNGFIIDAVVTDGGFGYTNTPTVRIFEGGGSGAQAEAVVSNGVVTAIHILDAGSGYTSLPVIVIAPPFIEQPVMNIAPMSLLSFSNLIVGTNYQLQEFKAGTWSNLGAAFTASSSTFTQYVSGTAGADDFRLAVTPVPVQAFATAQVVNGFVVGAIVTSGGSGYGSSPAVTISGGGGSNATAIARVGGGVVTNLTITSAGLGYTNTPTITIAPPPANALSPTVAQEMKLDIMRLAPYDSYQLEFSPVLGAPWTNLPEPFTPTSSTSTQLISSTDGDGFFRVRHLP